MVIPTPTPTVKGAGNWPDVGPGGEQEVGRRYERGRRREIVVRSSFPHLPLCSVTGDPGMGHSHRAQSRPVCRSSKGPASPLFFSRA